MSSFRTVSLETVFNAIPVGLAVVDPDRNIVMMNAAFHESLGLPPDTFPPGTPVASAVRRAAAMGVYGPGEPDEQVETIVSGDRSRPGRLRRRTFAGRSFDLYNTPLPDGGYIVSAVESTALLAARADAETALAKTAMALTTLRIGLGVFDPRGVLLLANPRFATLLALPPERVVPGFTFDAMLALMAEREEFAAADDSTFIRKLHDTERTRPFSTRRHRDDGTVIDLFFDPLPDGACAITISDITPQARAEDDARRRARLLDSVLVAVPHGICVYGPDQRVAMFNDTYIRVMAGAPLQVGDTLTDVIRRRAEAGEFGHGAPDAVFAEQMAHDIGRPQMRRRVRPNGTAIDIRTAPLPDGGHISVVTDMTALVQAEAELRRKAAELTVMLDNIRHGVMLWGPDQRLVASNPVVAQLLDLPADLLTPGRPESDVVEALRRLGHFGGSQPAETKARGLLERDRSVPFAREITTTNGRVIVVQSNPAPGGGWISTYTDITKMRETETELRRAKELAESANQAKSRFLATMSHELRTPLNAIIGFSDALTRDMPSDLVPDYGAEINAAGKQLLSLINMILDVARIEAGRFEAGGEVVDVGRLLHAAIRQADNAAMAAEVAIHLVLPERLPWVWADERLIAQAVGQLLSNGVRFTEAGGSITVEAGRTPAGDLFIAIIDTGIGIAESDQQRIFEPFTQVDDTLSRRRSGAGLGLYTVRAIVTAHGGTLELTSQPGQGTAARLVLPKKRIVD